jgi:hypothetical protein
MSLPHTIFIRHSRRRKGGNYPCYAGDSAGPLSTGRSAPDSGRGRNGQHQGRQTGSTVVCLTTRMISVER